MEARTALDCQTLGQVLDLLLGLTAITSEHVFQNSCYRLKILVNLIDRVVLSSCQALLPLMFWCQLILLHVISGKVKFINRLYGVKSLCSSHLRSQEHLKVALVVLTAEGISSCLADLEHEIKQALDFEDVAIAN